MAPITKKKHILESFNCTLNSQMNNETSRIENVNQSPVIVSPLSVSFPVIQSTSITHSKQIISESTSFSNGHSESSLHSNSMSNYDNPKFSNSPLSPLSPQYARVNRVVLDKNSDEYRKRRERNNIAVKKSR